MTTVPVGSSAGAYPVLVEPGSLGRLPALLAESVGAVRYAVVSDANVAPLHGAPVRDALRGAGLAAELMTFPAGEASKTRRTWSILTDEMLDAGLGRDACVVAVGGGVTTDLAGFAAATFLRGVPVVQVPTSYLAMIDASVGGKTGVDTRHGKNLVGAFHAPVAVVVDPAVLATLPVAERREGLVEAFKHGAIRDAGYLDALAAGVDALVAAEEEAATDAILRSVRIKAEVVTQDERESGLRQILNFGHTVGHAVEAASGFGLGHGSAVAVGMVAEAAVGEAMGVTAPGTASTLRAALEGLLGTLPSVGDAAAVASFLGSDKKVRAGRARCVLLREPGVVDPGSGWAHDVDVELVTRIVRDL